MRSKKARAKDKAWKWFSRYIRLRDCLKTTKTKDRCVCITCGATHGFKDIQAGHFVGGRNNSVLFDERMVNGQCMRCNVFLRGNYQAYTLIMIDRFGRRGVEKMLALKHKVKQIKANEFLEIAEKYKRKYERL